MKKVIILGLIEDRESVLETLQNVGIVHLEPFQIRKENINELIKKTKRSTKSYRHFTKLSTRDSYRICRKGHI